MKMSFSYWFKSGSPWVWLTGAAVAINVIMVAGLLILIASRGLVHFWPNDILQADYVAPNGSVQQVVGEVTDSEDVSAIQLREAGLEIAEGVEFVTRYLLKVGNRDVTGADFRWALEDKLTNKRYPEQLFASERREWGNFYGYLRSVKEA
ncbi:MAG: phosphate ABC transporter, permease protein PstA, partial [Motiliproteus sp.]|nr:phosphate ABC transporter, permease protein PstA [Motiliproteus sp.]